MSRKKSADKQPEGAEADIRLAMHELALTGGNKKRKAKTSINTTDSIKEKIYLFDKVQNGEASARELIYLSFLTGMTTKEQYLDYLQIEKDCAEYEDED
jgi:hypothetical protein